jgi:hypothetical protein
MISLPTQDNYPLARRLAVESLSRSDLRERAGRCGGTVDTGADGRERLRLRYLGRDILFSSSDGKLETAEGGSISLREEILILHYMETATGTPVTGRWISFSEFPGGKVYHPVFLKRCRDPLIKFAGKNPEILPHAAAHMDAESLGIGDIGLRITALPHVPLGLILWRGDADFPADGNVVLDASVSDYLPLEDTVILAETVVWKIIKNLSSSGLQVPS